MAQFIDPKGLLTEQELTILQEVDACPYEISYAKSLGDIHNKIPVYILDEKDPQEPTTFTANVSEEELEELKNRILEEMRSLERRINERKDKGEAIGKREKAAGKRDNDLMDKYKKFYDDICGIKPGQIPIPIGDILGEYVPDKKQPYVNLYIKTIRERKNKYCPSLWTLALVYAHEMHHAAYHTDHSIDLNTNTFIEEPMAELGMLRWAAHYQKEKELHGVFHRCARLWVASKKEYLPHYGFGAYLDEGFRPFRVPAVYPEMLVDATKPLMDSPLIQEYSLPFRMGVYPWPYEAHYKRLLREILIKL